MNVNCDHKLKVSLPVIALMADSVDGFDGIDMLNEKCDGFVLLLLRLYCLSVR